MLYTACHNPIWYLRWLLYPVPISKYPLHFCLNIHYNFFQIFKTQKNLRGAGIECPGDLGPVWRQVILAPVWMKCSWNIWDNYFMKYMRQSFHEISETNILWNIWDKYFMKYLRQIFHEIYETIISWNIRDKYFMKYMRQLFHEISETIISWNI